MSGPGFDPARRAFLRGAPLTGDGRRSEVRRQRPLGPRPPWLPDAVAASVCAQCSAPCIESCPVRIIERHGPEHRLEGSVYLSFEQAGCTFCGACAEVCPLTPAAEGTPRLGRASLDSDRCLAWKGVVCITCLGRCDVRALKRDAGGRVRVDPDLCTGCGACIAPCPEQALAFTAEPESPPT